MAEGPPPSGRVVIAGARRHGVPRSAPTRTFYDTRLSKPQVQTVLREL